MINRLLIIFCAVSALCLASCKSAQRAATSADMPAQTNMSPSMAYADLVSQYTPWSVINVPVKISMQAPQRFSMSGRLTMHRGKDIYLSLRFFGMEVANGLITNDSVFFADKYHKMYLAEGIRDVFGHYGLTVSELQDVILGRGFTLGRGALNADSPVTLSQMIGVDLWQVTPEKITSEFQYAYSVALSPQTGKTYISRLQIEPRAHRPLDIVYDDPAVTAAGQLAGSATVSTQVGTTPLQAAITLSLDRAKFEGDFPAQWTAPGADYRRLEANKLIDIFKSF